MADVLLPFLIPLVQDQLFSLCYTNHTLVSITLKKNCMVIVDSVN